MEPKGNVLYEGIQCVHVALVFFFSFFFHLSIPVE